MPLALLSAVAWATLDLLRKQLTAHVPLLALSMWLNVGFAPLFGTWAVLRGDTLPAWGPYLPVLAVALSVAISAQLLFLVALRLSGLSVVIPMLALTPALSATAEALWLGGAPDRAETAAIALIVGGCLANGLQRVDGRLTVDRGAAAMALVSILWAANGVIDKSALAYAAPPVHGTFVTSGTVVLLFLTLVVRRELRTAVVPREQRPRLVAAMLALGVAYAAQLMAFQVLLVGVVEAVKRAVGTIAALVNGAWRLGEPVDRGRVLAAVAIALGVVLLVDPLGLG